MSSIIKSGWVSVILILGSLIASSQSKPYWVFFADKDGVEFNPYNYFDQHTINRRVKYGIPLSDITDWPVRPDYLGAVSEKVDSLGYASRWLNAVGVVCDQATIQEMATWDFITEIVPMETELLPASKDYDSTLKESVVKRMHDQLDAMGGDVFKGKGLDGKGIRIAIFDAGFSGADISPAFQHIRDRNGVLMTWDFKKKEENVYHGHTHGTMVWSCIAGQWADAQSGLATGADFLLARTEGRGEPFEEETNWIAALEWADKNGADIINSSLGYTHNRYFPEQMDGKVAPISRAATLAARKGILVVNAAGNEGSGSWKVLGAPADADSILTVGGIQPETGIHTGFSSYGPTVDKRMKPNVCAFGWVGVAGKNKFTMSQGTSFSSPLVAGYAACTWQLFRDSSNMSVLKMIEQSGSLYPYFDYAHGYGVPQAARLTGGWDTLGVVKSLWILGKAEGLEIKTDSALNDQISFPGDQYLYCHIRGDDGVIKRYFVIKPEDENFVIPLKVLSEGDRLGCYYKGYYKEFKK